MITLVIVGILAERMCLIDQYYLRSFVKQNQLMKMQMRAYSNRSWLLKMCHALMIDLVST